MATGLRLLQPVSSASLSGSVAFGSPVNRASLLVLAIGSTAATTGVTDTQGNVWKLAVQSHVEANSNAAIYYTYANAAGGCTVTVTGGTVEGLAAWEVGAGFAKPTMGALGILDKTSNSAAASGVTADPGTITPSYRSTFYAACVSTTSVQAFASGWAGTFLNGGVIGVQSLVATLGGTQDGAFGITSAAYDVVCAAFGFQEPNAAAAVLPRAKPFLV